MIAVICHSFVVRDKRKIYTQVVFHLITAQIIPNRETHRERLNQFQMKNINRGLFAFHRFLFAKQSAAK